jgi:GAF domain-containing protein/ActR/RegA family two-component response regulator
MTQTLTGSLDLAKVLSLVAEGVRRLLSCEGGAIGLVDPDGAIRATAGVGLGVPAFSGVTVRPGQGIGGQVLARGEPFWTPDYVNDPRVSRDFTVQARAAGLVGGLAVPVRLRDEVVGVLWALYSRAVQITGEDLSLAADLAHVVAIAVHNARLYQEAKQREAEARALFEVGRLINATLDPERVLDLIVEKARELMRVKACGVFRLDQHRMLRYVRGAGLSPAFTQALSVPLAQGTSGRAIAERRPVWSADILGDPNIPLSRAARSLVEHEGYRAVLSVPIEIKDAPFGCLAAYWWERHDPSAGEIATLWSLATLAAVAFENAQLYHETRTHVERLESLNRVGRAVSASLRLDEVLGQVAQAAAELFGAVLATLWVADEENRVLTRRAGYADAEILAHLPERVPYGQGGVGRVAAERRALLDVPIERDSNILAREQVLALGIRTFTGVPVILGDRLLGVLTIGRRADPPLSTGDQALLEALIGQAAIAIENARLYEAARQHEAEAVALAEASRRFGATLRREAVVESLAEGAFRVLGETWTVLVVDPDTREVAITHRPEESPRSAPAPRDTATEGRLAAGRRLAADVIATCRALLLARAGDLPADHPVRPEIERWGIRSLLLVPVVTRGAVRAVLVGSIHDEGRQFTERDLRLAEAIADRAATALENARLFEELARAYQDLKTAQERLVQTERLRALGEMASGVAHDFNNSLAAILGRVQLVLRRVEDPTIRRWLEIVERAALDASQTVRRIQEFTRIRRDLPTETVDLDQIVRDAVEMTATRWRDETQSRGVEVRLVTHLNPIPLVDGHPAELREALMNLILNAVDAMPGGGTITVSTEAVESGVEVRIGDTGVGIPAEVRHRIFEPFFSTKGPQGTGLGLAMVYGIVSRHGGQIVVESTEGVGSTFQIRLPAGRGNVQARVAPVAAPVDQAARVLVIDDEEDVRETLADMLRERSHEVVVAENGAEGLERFQSATFDLVLTDLAMPGISGWQVAQAVKAARPDVPVVLVTGWGVELSPEQLRANGVDRVMTKPFRLQEVLEVVATLRRRPPDGA